MKSDQSPPYPSAPTAAPTLHEAASHAPPSAPSSSSSAPYYHHPYVQHAPAEKPPASPMESILHTLDSWGKKAEVTANNVWHNLRTSPSVSSAAWGKMNLTAKAISGGGFESLYKQNFTTSPNEKLKKTFACHISTSAGPVSGTLYLSNLHVAFCSDSPVSYNALSGQQAWSPYKVMVPLGKIGSVSPVIMKENSPEKYIQIVTADGYDFWFMGFVNFDKAVEHLSESISNFVVPGIAVPSSASS
ncbi:GEM-like protein 5 [Prosopis cineraria]|uniref:GEM-like protein 5 n=1 Tax=Prosopis cineraria TaxID=364024 RepID=UPI00240F71E5|nr:GEM-like protein 5 [Prosopis cineraria]